MTSPNRHSMSHLLRRRRNNCHHYADDDPPSAAAVRTQHVLHSSPSRLNQRQQYNYKKNHRTSYNKIDILLHSNCLKWNKQLDLINYYLLFNNKLYLFLLLQAIWFRVSWGKYFCVIFIPNITDRHHHNTGTNQSISNSSLEFRLTLNDGVSASKAIWACLTTASLTLSNAMCWHLRPHAQRWARPLHCCNVWRTLYQSTAGGRALRRWRSTPSCSINNIMLYSNKKENEISW